MNAEILVAGALPAALTVVGVAVVMRRFADAPLRVIRWKERHDAAHRVLDAALGVVKLYEDHAYDGARLALDGDFGRALSGLGLYWAAGEAVSVRAERIREELEALDGMVRRTVAGQQNRYPELLSSDKWARARGQVMKEVVGFAHTARHALGND